MKYQYEKNVVPNATGKAQGEIGESALWDGPLNQTGRPHKKGSSSGKDPMQVLKYPCSTNESPITRRAKGKM